MACGQANHCDPDCAAHFEQDGNQFSYGNPDADSAASHKDNAYYAVSAPCDPDYLRS